MTWSRNLHRSAWSGVVAKTPPNYPNPTLLGVRTVTARVVPVRARPTTDPARRPRSRGYLACPCSSAMPRAQISRTVSDEPQEGAGAALPTLNDAFLLDPALSAPGAPCAVQVDSTFNVSVANSPLVSVSRW